jgi:hypothetical protein
MITWQYGVRFLSDGSESWRFCGRTSRENALTELADLRATYKGDEFALVRRPHPQPRKKVYPQPF